MPESGNSRGEATAPLVTCAKCGERYASTNPLCPRCTAEIDRPFPITTQEIDRNPTIFPLSPGKRDVLIPGSPVLLQFLPSGMCITLALDGPAILGRHAFAATLTPGLLVDLAHLGAEKHGVSRLHCQLRRQGAHLILTDLGSTNGTYLNGERISPHMPHRLSEGDRLILGTLHLAVFFGPVNAQ